MSRTSTRRNPLSRLLSALVLGLLAVYSSWTVVGDTQQALVLGALVSLLAATASVGRTFLAR